MEPDLTEIEERFVLEAVQSRWISSIGKFVDRFEQEFAEYCDVPYAVGVCNGTAALHLALRCAGVGPGDEVIAPSLTFVATAAAICHAGAEPVFVDCDSRNGTMSVEAVDQAISARTKAIIPVHLYGHPADMDLVLALAAERDLVVVEDAAEAHGACYKGRKVGGLGDMGVFSFYGNKLLTTGEGGMITTRDSEVYRRLKFLRDHAMDPERRYWHSEIGFNYRMTNLQAAVGCAQLARVDEIMRRRVRILELYRRGFERDGVDVVINASSEWASCAIWLICLVLPKRYHSEDRDRICRELKSLGIDTRPYFVPNHMLPPYTSFRAVGLEGDMCVLNNSVSLSERGLNLPSSSSLADEDINRVISAVRQALAC